MRNMLDLAYGALVVVLCMGTAYAGVNYLDPQHTLVAYFAFLTFAICCVFFGGAIGRYEVRLARYQCVWVSVRSAGGKVLGAALMVTAILSVSMAVLGLGVIEQARQGVDTTWFWRATGYGVVVSIGFALIGALLNFAGNHFVKVGLREATMT